MDNIATVQVGRRTQQLRHNVTLVRVFVGFSILTKVIDYLLESLY